MNRRKAIIILSILMALFVSAEAAGWYVASRPHSVNDKPKSSKEYGTKAEARLSAENAEMKRRLAALAPKGLHVVIDTGRNILYLKNGNIVIREAVVSTGSGNVLEEPSGKRQWVFDTPRGVFSMKSKVKDPVWVKPDWAFIEEGEDIPSDPKERYEAGVLGDYALGFGNGYFIHGTLYTRLLGRNVTHGCVRVGDQDLKALYETIPPGTSILIF